jgi:plastocyanin
VPVTRSEPVTVTVTKLADGQTVMTPPYTVTVDPSLGTYDPQTNTFTAGRTPGAGKLVTEAAGNLRAETEVTVFNEFRVVISPNDRSANPGDTITFTAKLADYLGSEKPADPVEWSASAGTIDAAGSLTIPDMKGQLTVTATADGKTGTASVWVGIPKP